MEDAVRALQQQVNALMSQNAALEAQLVGQQNIAQGLAELPGAITTMLSRSQAPMRRMLVDPKGLGKPLVFSGREEHFYVWTKKVENYVSGVFPNVRGALMFAAESQDVVTAATVAIGVLELGVETSADTDGQLFVVLSALTEGESFDVVMSPGGDHDFESWRELHGRWNPYTVGRSGDSVADTSEIARVEKDPLGFLASQEGPLPLVFVLEMLYLLQPPNSSCFRSQNKEVFSTKNLMLCHVSTQTVLLPYHFFLFEVFRLESQGHHNNLGILFLELLPEAQYQLWREAFSFLCSQVNWSGNLSSLSIKDSAQIELSENISQTSI